MLNLWRPGLGSSSSYEGGELAAGGINGWVIGGQHLIIRNWELAAYPKLLFRAEAT